jgi:transcriptional regulator with XRE-family HTH domain
MNYSKAIRIARALSDIPQKELAERISLDPSLISMLEAGKRRPSLATLEKISEHLEIPFHLLTLLASEPDDLHGISQEEMAQLASGLTRLLFQGKIDEPNRGGRTGDSEAEHLKPGRIGRPARHKPQKTR